ncbi:hypothetical protein PENTCL1PPCAC_4669, partial [Pristionchus entomophagus]
KFSCLRKQTYYEFEPEDRLSTLPDELIRLILSELTHADLKSISEASRKLSHLAAEAKERKRQEELALIRNIKSSAPSPSSRVYCDL